MSRQLTDYKFQYEQVKKMLTKYQDELIPGFRAKIDELEKHVPKWIPVTERLPNKEEYTAVSEDDTEYYARLLIAYKTDIVEYEIGYYDGYKWMTEMPIRLIKDVVAWMPFPNMPEPPKGEKSCGGSV